MDTGDIVRVFRQDSDYIEPFQRKKKTELDSRLQSVKNRLVGLFFSKRPQDRMGINSKYSIDQWECIAKGKSVGMGGVG